MAVQADDASPIPYAAAIRRRALRRSMMASAARSALRLSAAARPMRLSTHQGKEAVRWRVRCG